jgi:hypothetical protein
MAPFHVKAQILRQSQLAPASALQVFDPAAGQSMPAKTETPGKGRWRQSDVKRAIAAADQAGLQTYRVEIAPDGTISIIVGAPSDTANPAPR